MEENQELNKIRKKVIIESGALKTPDLIRKASLLSMFAGADFVKTSTGKIDVSATPEAARARQRDFGCGLYALSARRYGGPPRLFA